MHWLQVYAEVLDWDPPTCDGRPVVALGGVARPAAVAAPALLPPPARAGAEAAAHPADPLPLVAGANTPRGAFFEVLRHCPARSERLAGGCAMQNLHASALLVQSSCTKADTMLLLAPGDIPAAPHVRRADVWAVLVCLL